MKSCAWSLMKCLRSRYAFASLALITLPHPTRTATRLSAVSQREVHILDESLSLFFLSFWYFLHRKPVKHLSLFICLFLRRKASPVWLLNHFFSLWLQLLCPDPMCVYVFMIKTEIFLFAFCFRQSVSYHIYDSMYRRSSPKVGQNETHEIMKK